MSEEKAEGISALGIILFGFIFTVLLTQIAIWSTFKILANQEIISNSIPWAQAGLMSVTISIAKLWWQALEKNKPSQADINN